MDYRDVHSKHVRTNWQVSSLTEAVILTCFYKTTIVPVHKEAKVTCLNEYCPVALMSVR